MNVAPSSDRYEIVAVVVPHDAAHLETQAAERGRELAARGTVAGLNDDEVDRVARRVGAEEHRRDGRVLGDAGLPDEEIREGVRRIGVAMGGQAGMYGALTGSAGAGKPTAPGTDVAAAEAGALADGAADGTGETGGLADVVQLPPAPFRARRPDGSQARRLHDQ